MRVGEAAYPRWCVVLEVEPDGSAIVLPCSTKFELIRDGMDFEIQSCDADFRHTGLMESSCVIETDAQRIHPPDIGKVKGRLTGDLARRFARWAGIPDPE